MELKRYLATKTKAERDAFAADCGSTLGSLRNVISGFRKCSAELAVEIERVSQKTVRRWDLRPSDWFRLWPELVGTDGAPKVKPPKATRAKRARPVSPQAVAA